MMTGFGGWVKVYFINGIVDFEKTIAVMKSDALEIGGLGNLS